MTYRPKLPANRSLLGKVVGRLVVCLALTAGVTDAETLGCTFVDKAGVRLHEVETRLTRLDDRGESAGEPGYRESDQEGLIEFLDQDPGTYRFEAQLNTFISMKRTLHLQGEIDLRQVLLRKGQFDQLNKEAKRALENADYQIAIDRLMILVSALPDRVVLHANLARAHAGALDQEKALAEADAAAAIDAKRFATLRQELQKRMLPELGQKAMYEMDFATASVHYEALREIDPKDPIAYQGLALSYGHLGRFKEALAAVDRAIELDPGNPQLAVIKSALESNAATAEGR
jgi:tetratricopeptide (TPR) repeat protein